LSTKEQRATPPFEELLPRALDAGISKREIARLAAVGRPWIDKIADARRQTG